MAKSLFVPESCMLHVPSKNGENSRITQFTKKKKINHQLSFSLHSRKRVFKHKLTTELCTFIVLTLVSSFNVIRFVDYKKKKKPPNHVT